MAKTRVLVDSSFLYALYDEDDNNYAAANAGLDSSVELFIPEVVLVEVTYLLKERVGIPTTVGFLDSMIETGIAFVNLVSEDLVRARDIMATYADANFDFVDCCIMALAERLTITHIYTFDRRDFRLFRPRHSDYLTLLP